MFRCCCSVRRARVSSDNGKRAALLWLSLSLWLSLGPFVSPTLPLGGFPCCVAEVGDSSAGDSSGERNIEADTDGSDMECASSGEGNDAEPVAGGRNGGGDDGVDMGFEPGYACSNTPPAPKAPCCCEAACGCALGCGGSNSMMLSPTPLLVVVTVVELSSLIMLPLVPVLPLLLGLGLPAPIPAPASMPMSMPKMPIPKPMPTPMPQGFAKFAAWSAFVTPEAAIPSASAVVIVVRPSNSLPIIGFGIRVGANAALGACLSKGIGADTGAGADADAEAEADADAEAEADAEAKADAEAADVRAAGTPLCWAVCASARASLP